MSPVPTDGNIVAVGQEENTKKYVCVFKDEAFNTTTFHQNINALVTVTDLYELVSKTINYDKDKFLLGYVEPDSTEVLLDINCDDTLGDVLKKSDAKCNRFNIKENEKIQTTPDEFPPPVPPREPQENTDTSDGPESYVDSFFKLEGNKENPAGLGSTLPSTHSTTPFSVGGYDTFKSGYVGLVNQAMTCYLNSLLQTLYMTPEFRNGLYRWRFKGSAKEEKNSIPFQLQRLFLQLQTSDKKAVETTGLTKSFGWESSDAWQQHDVQELCRVMFDKLEETLKDTDQENLINQLYQGELKDYVKCLKCNHENSRDDNYLDISVEIRPFGSKEPHKDLEYAIKAFVTPETLDGNNQYFCEKCNSKQDAHKGLKFLTFPYLLTVQLKRFTFDYNTLQRIKLPDKLTFPFYIDLNELIDDTSQNTTSAETEEKDCKCTATKDKGSNCLEEKIAQDEKEKEFVETDDLDDTDESKGPYKYELFSVLIHSGSAIGGHYYAYIKSFENQKWYCFNDQFVTEISEEEIKKSYGANDRYGSGYTSNYSSSTNAYMLMYRQIKPSKNVSFMKTSEWSVSLTDLCAAISHEEHKEQSRKEWEKNVCKITLYGYHPFKKNKLSAKLEIHKDKTLSDATEMAWEALEFQDVVPLSLCRIVKYDDYANSFLRSYEGCEEKAIGELLGSVRQSYAFDFLLEYRKEDETFPIYLPGGTTLKVYIVDLKENEFDEPRTFHVPLTYKVSEFKKLLESEIGLPAETMRVALYREYSGFFLFDKDTRMLKNEGIHKSATIFVEGLYKEDGELPFKESLFYQRLDIFTHSINLRIIFPSNDPEKPNDKKEMPLLVDKRITLHELKEKISKHIDVEPLLFRIFRTFSNDQEIECIRLTDTLNAYSDATKIIVKYGRALKDGEKRLKIYRLLINNDEHIKFLMDAIVNDDMSVEALKREQVLPEISKSLDNPTLERCRLRQKSHKNPSHIFLNDMQFDDTQIRYCSELFVEVLEDDDEFTSQDDMSVYICRWHPDSYTVDPIEEMLVQKKTTIAEFKQKIEEKTNIPMEFIKIAKGRNGSFPYKYSKLSIHVELEWDAVGQYLSDYPLGIHDDGHVIYYSDSRTELKQLTEEERDEIRKKERSTFKETSNTRNYRKEKALKIYTNGTRR